MLDHDSTNKNLKMYLNYFVIGIILILLVPLIFGVAAGQVTLIGRYDTPGWAFKVAVMGNYAYVADWSSMQIIDISDPTSPFLVGNYDDPRAYAYDVAVSGSYAYVASGYSGLLILDISNPSSPTLGGRVSTSDDAYGVAVLGNYAYVASRFSELHIIDISNPASPFITGSYRGDISAVAVTGNYAYLGDRPNGLTILDISDPTSPSQVVKGFGSCAHIERVVVIGDYAYVVDFGCAG